MTDLTKAGTFRLGDRMGYGAMQLAGPGVFGPPKNRETALAVLREAVAAGVDHIDTSGATKAIHVRGEARGTTERRHITWHC